MGTVASERGQVKDAALANVIPDSAAIPAAHTDFLKIVNAIEPRRVMRLSSISVAETEPMSIGPLENGMLVVTTSARTRSICALPEPGRRSGRPSTTAPPPRRRASVPTMISTSSTDGDASHRT